MALNERQENIGARPSTMKNVLADTLALGGDFYIKLGDFLDEFYSADWETKGRMIAERPAETPQMKREFLPFAAAAAHKLANDFGLDVPLWVFEKRCYLDDMPFFGCNAKGDLRLWFMYKSPTEFKHRNMFVDENVLSRV
jgi:hypothetical protein